MGTIAFMMLLAIRLNPPPMTPMGCEVIPIGDLVCCDVPGDSDPHCKHADMLSTEDAAGFELWCDLSGGETYEVEDAKGCAPSDGHWGA